MFASFSSTANAGILSLPTTGSNTSVSASDLSALNTAFPELNSLNSTLRTAESTARTLETVATPIYNQVVPTNMDTMGIVERCKAIISNAKNVLSDTLKTSTENANAKRAQGASVVSLQSDEKIALGIQELGKQAAKLDKISNDSTAIQKIKSILTSTKQTLSKVVVNVREKIFKVGQKVGLISKDKVFEDGKVVDKSEASGAKENAEISSAGYANASGAKVSFADKLSSGLKEGVANAKTSLKNSFSVKNLALTTAVSVGTSLAVDAINGETPSLKKAVKQVASLEFAGNVVGSALGAAGGQVVGTLVKTFVPGVVGSLIGSVIPVMFSSAGGQLTSNVITGIKNGEFSISKAFKQIDKADLVGSSIGSTIGMTLGSLIPVPVVGTVLGGIVGGVVGSKVAKWVSGLFGKKKSTTNNNVSSFSNQTVSTNYDNGVTFGNVGNTVSEIPVANAPVISASGEAVSSKASISSEKAQLLKECEEKYYQSYLEYNRKVEANDTVGAKAVFEDLKKYSDEYSQLKKSLK
jgi:uncharacterized membrane protein